MLHSSPDASDYDEERQLAELRGVVSSNGRVGLPGRGLHRLAAGLRPGGRPINRSWC